VATEGTPVTHDLPVFIAYFYVENKLPRCRKEFTSGIINAYQRKEAESETRGKVVNNAERQMGSLRNAFIGIGS
jgi:hypothetical protein